MREKKQRYDKSRREMRRERLRVPDEDLGAIAENDTHISGILKNVFKNIDSGQEDVKSALIQEWDVLAGPVAAKRTKPGRLFNHILTVFTQNSVWVSELSRTELRNMQNRIQERFGSDTIRKVVLRVG